MSECNGVVWCAFLGLFRHVLAVQSQNVRFYLDFVYALNICLHIACQVSTISENEKNASGCRSVGRLVECHLSNTMCATARSSWLKQKNKWLARSCRSVEWNAYSVCIHKCKQFQTKLSLLSCMNYVQTVSIGIFKYMIVMYGDHIHKGSILQVRNDMPHTQI